MEYNLTEPFCGTWKSNSDSETSIASSLVDVGVGHHLREQIGFDRHGCPSHSESERVRIIELLTALSHIDASWCVIHSQALICC